MCITYILQIAWLLMFCCLVIVTFVYTVFWKMCENPRVASLQDSIDLTQFCKYGVKSRGWFWAGCFAADFLFPAGTRQEHMKVEGESNVKAFCKDYVEKVTIMFILAAVSAVLVILSLVGPYHFCMFLLFIGAFQIHYLMCLSANYAHIRNQEKFLQFQDLQTLQDADLLSAKNRF